MEQTANKCQYFYMLIARKRYSFSQFDILSFQVNGVAISKTLKSVVGAQAYIVSEFKLISSDIRIDKSNNQQMRPYFCYKGFDTYKQNKTNGNFTKEQLKQTLISSGVKDEFSDLFYRTLDVDRAIISVEVEQA